MHKISNKEMREANTDEWYGISLSDNEDEAGDRIYIYLHASNIESMWDKLEAYIREDEQEIFFPFLLLKEQLSILGRI